MRELYLECYSGISGDMSVAALLDIGASEEHLRKTLKTMPLSGYSIEITRVKKSGIDACDFNVILDRIITTTIWSTCMVIAIRKKVKL